MPRRARRTPQVAVVHADQVPVGGQPDVALERLGAGVERGEVGTQGVLGVVVAGTPVGDDLRPHGRHCGGCPAGRAVRRAAAAPRVPPDCPRSPAHGGSRPDGCPCPGRTFPREPRTGDPDALRAPAHRDRARRRFPHRRVLVAPARRTGCRPTSTSTEWRAAFAAGPPRRSPTGGLEHSTTYVIEIQGERAGRLRVVRTPEFVEIAGIQLLPATGPRDRHAPDRAARRRGAPGRPARPGRRAARQPPRAAALRAPRLRQWPPRTVRHRATSATTATFLTGRRRQPGWA